MPDPAVLLLIAAVVLAIMAWLFWPERGQFWAWQRLRQVTGRVRSEDALKHMHRCERHGTSASVESLAGALRISVDDAARLVGQMVAGGLVCLRGDTLHLTPDGCDVALNILRAHRLWERYLADRTGFTEAEWHDRAEQLEHLLSPDEVNALAAQLGNPTHDPHGDPIPTAAGQLATHGGQPLTALSPNVPARVVHVEDEPETVYAQLVAEDIHPGTIVRVLEISEARLRLWAHGNEHWLAPIVAANVSVVPLTTAATTVLPGERLSRLALGETAQVVGLTSACRGGERRRFMDLGILPGAEITAELRSPSGDPTAYRIRDTLIALRQEQADHIHVRRASVADATPDGSPQ